MRGREGKKREIERKSGRKQEKDRERDRAREREGEREKPDLSRGRTDRKGASIVPSTIAPTFEILV